MLTLGTDVAVDEDGNVTAGSGAKLAIYNALLAKLPQFQVVTVDGEQQFQAVYPLGDYIAPIGCFWYAGIANALAEIVDYVATNAEVSVTVSTSDAGLQRTPDPNNPNTATQGPASDQTLSGTIS